MGNEKNTHAKVNDFKYVTELTEGDTLCRTRDNSFYTIRKVHVHKGENREEKVVKIFEFDGFLVNQGVMRNMFKCEKFAENYYNGKKLITYVV